MTNQRCLLCSNILEKKTFSVFDTRFGIDDGYEIAVCPICHLEQTILTFTPLKLKQFYEKYYNFGGENNTKYTNQRERLLSSEFYKMWLVIDGDISFHLLKGVGRLLDVGCNEGRGLTIYRKNGFKAEGLELNEKAATSARSKDFVVYPQLLEQFYPDDSYEVVVLSNVLEHSLDPKDMLNHVWRVLKSGGEVRISCPNNKSWLRSFFGRYWINWHVPFHIVHFSPVTLQKILTKCGFINISIRQETPALWVAHSIISFFFAKKGKATKQLRNPYLIILLMLLIRGVFFPFLWLGNFMGRGDCLVVVAQRE